VRSTDAFSFWVSFARAKLGHVKCDPGTLSAFRDCCAFSSLSKTLGSKQGKAGTSCNSELSGTVSLGVESEDAKPEKLPGGISTPSDDYGQSVRTCKAKVYHFTYRL
jgi:hypothetical protein